MSSLVLDEGRPVNVDPGGDRIGRGPWARLLASTVVPDESTARAERGRVLARSGHVHTVTIEPGRVSARVIGSGGAEYDVTLAAAAVPPRTWAAVSGSPRMRPLIAAALQGKAQSMHLQHEMLVDWEEPLVPLARTLRHSCTCPDAEFTGVCKHVAAVAYVMANAIDTDPSLLLRWRGCLPAADSGGPGPEPAPVAAPSPDRWHAGPLPELGSVRTLPVGAVLKRLGTSGISVDGAELADALRPAYAAFATMAKAPPSTASRRVMSRGY